MVFSLVLLDSHSAWVKLATAATFTLAVSTQLPTSAQANRALLKGAGSWAYQLQGDPAALARSGADVIVIDADHMRGAVSRLRTKPDGSRRAVIGYLAIGEVENWRSYYKSCCAANKPDWVTSKTQGWAGNYVVHFWRPEWKAIVKSRIDQMMSAGFDGIYIDRVDTWENVKAPGRSKGAMIELVKQVSAWTRAHNGNAAIMVQNGEELLDNGSYLAAIDAIAKEDLLHGIDHKGSRNSGGDIIHSTKLLKGAQAAGKKIFVIEYLKGNAADNVRSELRKLGFVPFFGPRDLKSIN